MVPRDGSATRERILNEAHGLALAQGFGATSIDKVMERAGVTKGAFFHHFNSKADLAQALVLRYARQEEELVAATMARAERLSRDPLQRLLIFVGLFEEMFTGHSAPHPGCLFASFCYQSELVDDATIAIISASMLKARKMLREKLQQVADAYPPSVTVSFDSLADLFTGIFEGAFILERTLQQPGVIAAQLGHYKQYLELLFHGGGRGSRA